MVTLGLAESSIVSISTTVLAALCGMLLGLIVYVWRTNIAGLKDEVGQSVETTKELGLEVRRMDRSKVEVSALEKVVEEMRVEQKENQARYVFLNETLTGAVSDMRREFARSSECESKHAAIHELHQMLARQLGENKEVLQIISGKVDQILEWKAFKSGEENARGGK